MSLTTILITAAAIAAATATAATIGSAKGKGILSDQIENPEEERLARQSTNPNIREISGRTFMKVPGIRTPQTFTPATLPTEPTMATVPQRPTVPTFSREADRSSWVEIMQPKQDLQQDSAIIDTSDPKANTSLLASLSNVFFNEGEFTFNPLHWIENTVDSFIWDINGDGKDSLIKNMFVDPFTHTDNAWDGFKAMGVNTLIMFGNDSDLLSNPIKGALEDGWRGFGRGLGVTGEGRYIYNFNIKTGTGFLDFIANMGAELLVSLPTLAASAAGKAIKAASAVSKAGLKTTLKEVTVGALDEAAKKAAEKHVKKVTKELALEIIQSHSKEAVKIQIKELGLNSLEEATTVQLKKITTELLTKDLVEEMTSRYVKTAVKSGAESAFIDSVQGTKAELLNNWYKNLKKANLPKIDVTPGSTYDKLLSSAISDITKTKAYNDMTAVVLSTIKDSRYTKLYTLSKQFSDINKIWNETIDNRISGFFLKAYTSPFKLAGATTGRIVSIPGLVTGKSNLSNWIKNGSGISKQIRKGVGGITTTVWNFLTQNEIARQVATMNKLLGNNLSIEDYRALKTILNTQGEFIEDSIKASMTKNANLAFKMNKLSPETWQNQVQRAMKRSLQEDANTYHQLVSKARESGYKVLTESRDASEKVRALMSEASLKWEEYLANKYNGASYSTYKKFLNEVNAEDGNLNDLLASYTISDGLMKMATAEELAIKFEKYAGESKVKLKIDHADTNLKAQVKSDSAIYNKEQRIYDKLKGKKSPIPTDAKEIDGYVDKDNIDFYQSGLDDFHMFMANVDAMQEMLNSSKLFFKHIQLNIDGVPSNALEESFKAAWFNLYEFNRFSNTADNIHTARTIAKFWIEEAEEIFNRKYMLTERVTISKFLGELAPEVEEQLTYTLAAYITGIKNQDGLIIPQIGKFKKINTINNYLRYLDEDNYRIALEEAAKNAGYTLENFEKLQGNAQLLPMVLREALAKSSEAREGIEAAIKAGDVGKLEEALNASVSVTRMLDLTVGKGANPSLILYAKSIEDEYINLYNAAINSGKDNNTLISDFTSIARKLGMSEEDIIKYTPEIVEIGNSSFITDASLKKAYNSLNQFAQDQLDYTVVKAIENVNILKKARESFMEGIEGTLIAPSFSVGEVTRKYEGFIGDLNNRIKRLEARIKEFDELGLDNSLNNDKLIKLKNQRTEVVNDPRMLELEKVKKGVKEKLDLAFRRSGMEFSDSYLDELASIAVSTTYKRLVAIEKTQSLPAFRRNYNNTDVLEHLLSNTKNLTQEELFALRQEFDNIVTVEVYNKFKLGHPEISLQEFKNIIKDKDKNMGKLVNDVVMDTVGVRVLRGNFSVAEMLEEYDRLTQVVLESDIAEEVGVELTSLAETIEVPGEYYETTLEGQIPSQDLLMPEGDEGILAEVRTSARLDPITGKVNLPEVGNTKAWESLVTEAGMVKNEAVDKILSNPNLKTKKDKWGAVAEYITDLANKPSATRELVAKKFSGIFIRGPFAPFMNDELNNLFFMEVFNTFWESSPAWVRTFEEDPDLAIKMLFNKIERNNPELKEELGKLYSNNLKTKEMVAEEIAAEFDREISHIETLIDKNRSRRRSLTQPDTYQKTTRVKTGTTEKVYELNKDWLFFNNEYRNASTSDEGMVGFIKEYYTPEEETVTASLVEEYSQGSLEELSQGSYDLVDSTFEKRIKTLKDRVSKIDEELKTVSDSKRASVYSKRRKAVKELKDLEEAFKEHKQIQKRVLLGASPEPIQETKPKTVQDVIAGVEVDTEELRVIFETVYSNRNVSLIRSIQEAEESVPFKVVKGKVEYSKQSQVSAEVLDKELKVLFEKLNSLQDKRVLEARINQVFDEQIFGVKEFRDAMVNFVDKYKYYKVEGVPNIETGKMGPTGLVRVMQKVDQDTQAMLDVFDKYESDIGEMVIERFDNPLKEIDPIEKIETRVDKKFLSDEWETEAITSKRMIMEDQMYIENVYGSDAWDEYVSEVDGNIIVGKDLATSSDVSEVAEALAFMKTSKDLAKSTVVKKFRDANMKKALTDLSKEFEEVWQMFMSETSDLSSPLRKLFEGLNSQPIEVRASFLNSLYYANISEHGSAFYQTSRARLQGVMNDLKRAPFNSNEYKLGKLLEGTSYYNEGYISSGLIKNYDELNDIGDMITLRDRDAQQYLLESEMDAQGIRIGSIENLEQRTAMAEEHSWLQSQVNDFFRTDVNYELELQRKMVQREEKEVLPRWRETMTKHHVNSTDPDVLKIFTDEDWETFEAYFYGRNDNSPEYIKKFEVLENHLEIYNNALYDPEESLAMLERETYKYSNRHWKRHRETLDKIRKDIRGFFEESKVKERMLEEADRVVKKTGNNPLDGLELSIHNALAKIENELSEMGTLNNYWGSDPNIRKSLQDIRDTMKKYASGRDPELYADELIVNLNALIDLTDGVDERFKRFKAVLLTTNEEFNRTVGTVLNIEELMKHVGLNKPGAKALTDALFEVTGEPTKDFLLEVLSFNPALVEAYSKLFRSYTLDQSPELLSILSGLGLGGDFDLLEYIRGTQFEKFERNNIVLQRIRQSQNKLALMQYERLEAVLKSDIRSFQDMFIKEYVELFHSTKPTMQMLGRTPVIAGGINIVGEEALKLNTIHKELRERNLMFSKATNDFIAGNIKEITSKTAEEIAEHLAFTGPFNIFDIEFLKQNPGSVSGSDWFDASGNIKKDAAEKLGEYGVRISRIDSEGIIVLALDKNSLGYRTVDGAVFLNDKAINRKWTAREFEFHKKFNNIADNTTGMKLGYSLGDRADNSFVTGLFEGNEKGFVGFKNLPGTAETTYTIKGVEGTTYTLDEIFGGWTNEDLVSGLYFPERRFNEMIYGDSNFAKRFGIYRKTNPVLGAYDRIQDLSMMTKSRQMWTLDMLDKSYSIGAGGGYSNFSDLEIMEFLDRNPEWTLVVTYSGGKNQGIRVRNWVPFYGEKDIARARKMDAKLIPISTYKQLNQTLNHKLYNNTFLHMWHRMQSWYKTLALGTNMIGTVINNLLDTSYKTYMDGAWEENMVNPIVASSIFNEYKDIINYISELGVSGENGIKRLFETENIGLMARLKHFRSIDGTDFYSPYEAFKLVDDFFAKGSGGGLITSFKTSNELHTLARAKVNKDYGSWLTDLERGAQGRVFGIMSWMGAQNEEANRLSMFLSQIKASGKKEGAEHFRAIHKANEAVRKTHFDYAFKSGIERVMDYVVPFSSFIFLNMEYWWNMIQKRPSILKRIMQLERANWEANDYTPEQIEQFGLFNPIVNLTNRPNESNLFLKAEATSFGSVFNTVFDPWESLKFRINLPGAQAALSKLTENYKGESFWDTKDNTDKLLTATSWIPGSSTIARFKDFTKEIGEKDAVGIINKIPGSGATTIKHPQFKSSPQTAYRDVKFVRSKQLYRLNDTRPAVQTRAYERMKLYNVLPNMNPSKIWTSGGVLPIKAKGIDKITARKESAKLYGIKIAAFR